MSGSLLDCHRCRALSRAFWVGEGVGTAAEEKKEKEVLMSGQAEVERFIL